jgi:hypothetical protein
MEREYTKLKHFSAVWKTLPTRGAARANQTMSIAFHNWAGCDNRTPVPMRSLNEAMATRQGPSSCFRGEASESPRVDTSPT